MMRGCVMHVIATLNQSSARISVMSTNICGMEFLLQKWRNLLLETRDWNNNVVTYAEYLNENDCDCTNNSFATTTTCAQLSP